MINMMFTVSLLLVNDYISWSKTLRNNSCDWNVFDNTLVSSLGESSKLNHTPNVSYSI